VHPRTLFSSVPESVFFEYRRKASGNASCFRLKIVKREVNALQDFLKSMVAPKRRQPRIALDERQRRRVFVTCSIEAGERLIVFSEAGEDESKVVGRDELFRRDSLQLPQNFQGVALFSRNGIRVRERRQTSMRLPGE